MDVREATSILQDMADEYMESAEMWFMEARDEPSEYEEYMHRRNSCCMKADAIRAVLVALNHKA